MLAARIIAAHHASLDGYRRAARPNQPPAFANPCPGLLTRGAERHCGNPVRRVLPPAARAGVAAEPAAAACQPGGTALAAIRPHAKWSHRLKNGAPAGDPSTAPRCGAHTRAGTECRQPAMPNGRCRMHGGRSTGPRTADGLARLRAAHTTHGFWSQESRAFRRFTSALLARTRLLCELVRPRSAPRSSRSAKIPGRGD